MVWSCVAVGCGVCGGSLGLLLRRGGRRLLLLLLLLLSLLLLRGLRDDSRDDRSVALCPQPLHLCPQQLHLAPLLPELLLELVPLPPDLVDAPRLDPHRLQDLLRLPLPVPALQPHDGPPELQVSPPPDAAPPRPLQADGQAVSPPLNVPSPHALHPNPALSELHGLQDSGEPEPRRRHPRVPLDYFSVVVPPDGGHFHPGEKHSYPDLNQEHGRERPQILLPRLAHPPELLHDGSLDS
mmetsp:Transcript_21089/g.39536  ORF Transcript_21089/g.39536 Transcript_21089/m.39536 type:complete len:239 (-) Transcript_21089:1189-1905(-)